MFSSNSSSLINVFRQIQLKAVVVSRADVVLKNVKMLLLTSCVERGQREEYSGDNYSFFLFWKRNLTVRLWANERILLQKYLRFAMFPQTFLRLSTRGNIAAQAKSVSLRVQKHFALPSTDSCFPNIVWSIVHSRNNAAYFTSFVNVSHKMLPRLLMFRKHCKETRFLQLSILRAENAIVK